MTRARLAIDLDAITANWRALDELSAPGVETSAVLKADAYGLGAVPVGQALHKAGVKTFFVALAEEGAELRAAIGAGPRIFLLNGYITIDRELIVNNDLIPVLGGHGQFVHFRSDLRSYPCALQIDIGMNRLGFKPKELGFLRRELPKLNLQLIIGHLACSDDPHSDNNQTQAKLFESLTSFFFPGCCRSLCATGGILLEESYHFDLTRPGIGLFGGLPFDQANPVVTLSVPILGSRRILAGEAVGYGASFIAPKPMMIFTVAAGYADGLPRSLADKGKVYVGGIACPIVGRVSMDLITIDVTHLMTTTPDVEILGPNQSIDQLAQSAGTIGYEILTSLGTRFERHYKGG